MPPGFPDALRRTAKRFLNEYTAQMRTFKDEFEVAPGVLVRRTGGHTRAGARIPSRVGALPTAVRVGRRPTATG